MVYFFSFKIEEKIKVKKTMTKRPFLYLCTELNCICPAEYGYPMLGFEPMKCQLHKFIGMRKKKKGTGCVIILNVKKCIFWF